MVILFIPSTLITEKSVTNDVRIEKNFGKTHGVKFIFIDYEKRLFALERHINSYPQENIDHFFQRNRFHAYQPIKVLGLLESSQNMTEFNYESMKPEDMRSEIEYFTKNPIRALLPYYIDQRSYRKVTSDIVKMVDEGWISRKKSSVIDTNSNVIFLSPLPVFDGINLLDDFSDPDYGSDLKRGLWSYLVQWFLTPRRILVMNRLQVSNMFISMGFKDGVYVSDVNALWTGMRTNKEQRNDLSLVTLTNEDVLKEVFEHQKRIVKTRLFWSKGNEQVMFVKVIDDILTRANQYTILPAIRNAQLKVSYPYTAVTIKLIIRPKIGDIASISGVWFFKSVPIVVIADWYQNGCKEFDDMKECFMITLMSEKICKGSLDSPAIKFDPNMNYGRYRQLRVVNTYKKNASMSTVEFLTWRPSIIVGKGSGKSSMLHVLDGLIKSIYPIGLFLDQVVVDSDDIGNSFDPTIDDRLYKVWSEKGRNMTYQDVVLIYNDLKKEYEKELNKISTSGRKMTMFHDATMIDIFSSKGESRLYESNLAWWSIILNRDSHSKYPKEFDLYLAELYRMQYIDEPENFSTIPSALLAISSELASDQLNWILMARIPPQSLEENGWCSHHTEPHVTILMARKPNGSQYDMKQLERLHSGGSIFITSDVVSFDTIRGKINVVKVVITEGWDYTISQSASRSLYIRPFISYHYSYQGLFGDCSCDPGQPFSFKLSLSVQESIPVSFRKINAEGLNPLSTKIVIHYSFADDISSIREVRAKDKESLSIIARTMNAVPMTILNDGNALRSTLSYYDGSDISLIITVHGDGYKLLVGAQLIDLSTFIQQLSDKYNLSLLLVTCRPGSLDPRKEIAISSLENSRYIISSTIGEIELVDTEKGTHVLDALAKGEPLDYGEWNYILRKAGWNTIDNTPVRLL